VYFKEHFWTKQIFISWFQGTTYFPKKRGFFKHGMHYLITYLYQFRTTPKAHLHLAWKYKLAVTLYKQIPGRDNVSDESCFLTLEQIRDEVQKIGKKRVSNFCYNILMLQVYQNTFTFKVYYVRMLNYTQELPPHVTSTDRSVIGSGQNPGRFMFHFVGNTSVRVSNKLWTIVGQ